MVNKKQEYLHLFEIACADLKLVEKNAADKDIHEYILLFHLQQAVEKLLKALLSYHQIEFPRTHDIAKLIELCEDNKIALPDYTDEIIKLTPFAVEFRYGIIDDEVLETTVFYRIAAQLKEFVEKSIFPV